MRAGAGSTGAFVGEIGARGEISSSTRRIPPHDVALLLTTCIEANAAWVIRTALGDERLLEGPKNVTVRT